MVKIWNIDMFEKDYNKGSLRYGHHKLALSCRKEYCLESVNTQTIKTNKKNWLSVFMFDAYLVSTFSEAI